MTRKVINKNIIELKREGYVPGLPAQGPISLPKELVDKLGLGVSGNTIYSLQLVNPIKGERVNFIYTDTDIKTHNDILEWCDSFIDFTTWSVEIVCIATSLEFEDDNNFDHPKLANLELENLAKYIAEKFDCKTKTNDNEIEISLSWSGNSRLIGEAQINEIEIELNSISLIEKIGLSIKRIQWIDPKTFARFGDITHILHPNRSEIKKLSDIQRTSKKLYRLLSSINGYYTQLSIRSKIILGFQLIEDYALDGQNPSLLEFNSEKKEAAKEKKTIIENIFNILENYITNQTDWEGNANHKDKLKESISSIFKWKINSPNRIMSHLISELKKQPIGKSKKEINRLRKIRGTLAHSYELNNKEMKEYLWSIRYIDNILQLIVKNEISALNLEK